uniref:Uncharacterized protein n=1 Tax=Ditylenchus dipsaci TaxID=166011 RepID=A0A915D7P1_9BILA
MFNLLIFGLIASNLVLLHGLVIDFKDPAANYFLHLTTTSIVGEVNVDLDFQNLFSEANFMVTTIKKVTGRVYTEDLSADALSLELLPLDERIGDYISTNNLHDVAKQGDLGVYVEFFPEIVYKSTGASELSKYSWKLWLNFCKQKADFKAEGFSLCSYALKSSVWMSAINFNAVSMTFKTLGYDSSEKPWYANSEHASNFICSSSTLQIGDTQVVFKDLRVTANLNVANQNSVYAVCSQDCVMEDKDCLRKGEYCYVSTFECPKYTLSAESSATSTFSFFTLSILPIFLLPIVL